MGSAVCRCVQWEGASLSPPLGRPAEKLRRLFLPLLSHQSQATWPVVRCHSPVSSLVFFLCKFFPFPSLQFPVHLSHC